jgi:hypothetical protein
MTQVQETGTEVETAQVSEESSSPENEQTLTFDESTDLTSLSEEDFNKLQEQEESNDSNEPELDLVAEVKQLKEMLSKRDSDLKTVEKKSDDRQSFILRQSQVIDGLKKKMDNLKTQKQEIEDISSPDSLAWSQSPAEAVDARLKAQKIDAEIKETEQELNIQSFEVENRQKIDSFIPNFESIVDDIAQYFKDTDPLTKDSEIEAFKQNPYLMNADKAIHFAGKAENHKLRKDLGLSKAKITKNEKLKNAEMFKTATSTPGGVSDTDDDEMNYSYAELAKMKQVDLDALMAKMSK